MYATRSVSVHWDTRDSIRARLDTKVEAHLVFSGHWVSVGNRNSGYRPDEETVKQVAKVLVKPFEYEEGDNRPWHATYLKEIECTHEGDMGSTWRVLIIEPATD